MNLRIKNSYLKFPKKKIWSAPCFPKIVCGGQCGSGECTPGWREQRTGNWYTLASAELMAWHGMVCHAMLSYSMLSYGMLWHQILGMEWYGMEWLSAGPLLSYRAPVMVAGQSGSEPPFATGTKFPVNCGGGAASPWL